MRENIERKVVCPHCQEEVSVFGNGFYASYECPNCSTEEEPKWFNLFGQPVCTPAEQMQLDDF